MILSTVDHRGLALYALQIEAAAFASSIESVLRAADHAYAQGISTNDIARTIGWSRSTLWRRMKEAGHW